MAKVSKLLRKTRQEREIEVNGETLREEQLVTHSESENGKILEEIILTRSIGERIISSKTIKDSDITTESETNTNLKDQSEIDEFEKDWKIKWQPRLENFPLGDMNKYLEMNKAGLAIENSEIPPLTIEEIFDSEPENDQDKKK